MTEVLTDLEKFFKRQKQRFYGRIERLKQEKLNRYKQITAELSQLREHEKTLGRQERTTAAQLNRLRQTITRSIQKEIEDKKRFRLHIEELRKLRRELPRLKALVKVSKAQKEKIFGKEQALAKELNQLHQRVFRKGLQKEKLQAMLRDLTNREKLLRSGKIYWHLPQRKRKKAKVRKAATKVANRPAAKRKSLLSSLFGK